MLFPKLQKDLAEELDMTRQNFNYHWSSARGQLILDYIEYFKSLISKYIRLQYGNTHYTYKVTLCPFMFRFHTADRQNRKRKPSLKGISYLILHSITHACIAYMLVANWSCWQIPAIVFISHFIIDLVKCKYSKESLSTFIFVISLYCIDL